MENSDFLEVTEFGLFCPEGDFFIDPWKPAKKAVITQGHGRHPRHPRLRLGTRQVAEGGRISCRRGGNPLRG